MSLGDRLGLVGVILGLIAIAAPYLWPDKKWIGWISLSLAAVLIAMWSWLEFKPHVISFYRAYPVRSTVLVFVCSGLLGSSFWLWMIRGNAEPKQESLAKPPTLLDLFKNDFPNAMKASDTNIDAYTIGAPGGSTIKVKRQTYMDFDAKTKFIGFYVSSPSPPPVDFSADTTFAACMELLKHGAVQDTFDHFDGQVAVLGGRGDQMTAQKDLTFSGRVLIYHEEFLSIPQKAHILDAYKTKGMEVIFRGSDYLGDRAIAWHQQHDAKK